MASSKRQKDEPRTAAPKAMPALPAVDERAQGVATWLMCGLMLIIVVGYMALRAPGVTKGGIGLSTDKAFFAAVNAATLTGFQQDISYAEGNPTGPLILLLLTVVGALITLIVSSMAMVRALRLPIPDGRLVRAALVCVLGSALAGGLVLHLSRPAGDSLTTPAQYLEAAAAFANSGISTGVDPDHGRPRIHAGAAWQSQAVVFPLAILGGLGLPVLLECLDALRGKSRLSRHSRVVLASSALLYLLGVALLTFIPLSRGEAPDRASLTWASAMSVDARTLGQPVVAVSGVPILRWCIIALMVVGASPASTGGGLKATTLFELFRGTRRALRAEAPGRAFGVAVVWAFMYFACAAIASLILMQLNGGSRDPVFHAFSALSNVGLGPDDRLSLVGPSLFVLSGAMLFGRMMPMLILWWLAGFADDKTDIAIG